GNHLIVRQVRQGRQVRPRTPAVVDVGADNTKANLIVCHRSLPTSDAKKRLRLKTRGTAWVITNRLHTTTKKPGGKPACPSGLLLLRLLENLACPDLFEALEVGPERARPGEDQPQVRGLEVLSKDVQVVRLRQAKGLHQ